MKKSSWKWVLCLALVAVMLTCTALAAIAQEDVAAASGTTITVGSDGKLTVEVSGLTGDQYVLMQVKVQSDAATPAALLADPPSYAVGEDTILYIDQDEVASGKVTFSNFLPKSTATSLFVLGGDAEPKVVGALLGKGVTITGTVALKSATAATEVKVEALDASGAVLAETTATTAANGTGTYTLDGVPAEAVKLKASTADKYVAREYAITADTTTQNVELWPKGDTDGNGNVNMSDYTNMLRHVKKTRVLTDYTLKCADTDNNGNVNMSDYTNALRHVKKTRPLW